MNLVIHAGAHKTATTSLQVWLKRSQRLLSSAQTLYIPPDVINQAGLIDELHNCTEGERANTTNRFLRLLSGQSARKALKSILISHESILSFSEVLPETIVKGFYGSLENSAPCINKLSEEYQVKLIFYVRRQDAFLASVYLEYLKRGNTFLDFKSYCEAMDYKNVSWLKCLDRMSELMPDVEIEVMPFEMIQAGDAEFLKAFLKAAGIEIENLPADISFPRSNESVSQTAMLLMQACGPHVRPPKRRMLGHYFREKFPTSEEGKAKVMTPKLSREIVKHFSKENALLFEKWMPSFSEYKY